MRRQLFAAGVAVALMLGAGAPALATPGHGKAKGHDPAKTKPAPKGPKAHKPKVKPHDKSGVSGGGETANGSFSAQARSKHAPKGHFNYTAKDGSLTLRCRGFSFVTNPPVKAGTEVEFKNCVTVTGAEPTQVRQAVPNVKVTFVDNGQPSATVKDSVTFDFGGPRGGALTGGNIKIRETFSETPGRTVGVARRFRVRARTAQGRGEAPCQSVEAVSR